jgi:hypothetical protein
MRTLIRPGITSIVILSSCVVILPGCSETPEDEGPSQPGQIIYAFKDNKPFIVMDMFPEMGRYKRLSPAAREEYLLRSALAALRSLSAAKEQYKGKETSVVRMLLVKSKGEYDDAQWGIAAEIALLEINNKRAAELVGALDSLKGDALRQCFSSVKVQHNQIQ